MRSETSPSGFSGLNSYYLVFHPDRLLATRLGRVRQSGGGPDAVDVPVGELLEVDREYREGEGSR